MNGKEITDKIKELNKLDSVTCTEKELNEYISCGIIIQDKTNYITRDGKIININIIKPKTYKFNIDLTDVINISITTANKLKITKVYCMSKETYNKYKAQDLIINKDNDEYYRFFQNELWKVIIM